MALTRSLQASEWLCFCSDCNARETNAWPSKPLITQPLKPLPGLQTQKVAVNGDLRYILTVLAKEENEEVQG